MTSQIPVCTRSRAGMQQRANLVTDSKRFDYFTNLLKRAAESFLLEDTELFIPLTARR